MMGRKPATLLVENEPTPMSLSVWRDQLKVKASRVSDNVDMELSSLDFVDEEFDPPITVDDRVMLHAGDR